MVTRERAWPPFCKKSLAGGQTIPRRVNVTGRYYALSTQLNSIG